MSTPQGHTRIAGDNELNRGRSDAGGITPVSGSSALTVCLVFLLVACASDQPKVGVEPAGPSAVVSTVPGSTEPPGDDVSSSPVGGLTVGTWPPGDPRAQLTPISVPPIGGYGDFSQGDPFEVDSYEINRLLSRCMNDHGFAVTLRGDGLGTRWEDIPPEQNQLATAVSIACLEGLNVPDLASSALTQDQYTEVYAYRTELAECVRGQGYQVPDPPSLDVFVEEQGRWSPYDAVGVSAGSDGDRLNQTCPQEPVGGFGVWDPGDAIVPYEP